MVDSNVRAAALVAAALCVPPIAWSQTAELLSITGVPAATVQAGQAYSFAPVGVATGPVAPHFEVQNLPTWASFGWAGQLTGTPATTDAGTYSNISISIVAGDARASLPVFSITVQAANSVAAPVTISWTPPTTNSDGSVLTDLQGYRIYAGGHPDQMIPILWLPNAGLTSFPIEGLSPGWHFFAMTAVSSLGLESTLSALAVAFLQ